MLSKGNEQREIFSDDDNRQLFLKLLGEMAECYEVEIYSYVLMTNYYHILLKTKKVNLSKSLRWFGMTCTERYNIRYNRSRHLFQDRFKSFLVEKDGYIHRNPLRVTEK